MRPLDIYISAEYVGSLLLCLEEPRKFISPRAGSHLLVSYQLGGELVNSSTAS